MSEVAAVQIMEPIRAGRGRSAKAGDLVLAHADAFARRHLFAHAGHKSLTGRPLVSAPFLAQHIDQEWVRRDPPVDTRRAAQSYTRAATSPASRRGAARVV